MDEIIYKKIEEFFKNSKKRRRSKGETLIFANEDPVGAYWLIEGRVEQYDIMPNGQKVAVNIFKPPAFFPMSWCINKTPNEYFFSATEPITYKVADADKVVEFLKKNPDVLLNLLSRVYQGTDGLLRRLVLATSSDAKKRLIYEMLIEGYRFGAKLENGDTKIKIKQSELASTSGLARETISREMHFLEVDNLITRERSAITFKPKVLEKQLSADV